MEVNETGIRKAMLGLAKLQETMSGVDFALSDVDVATWESMAGKLTKGNNIQYSLILSLD